MTRTLGVAAAVATFLITTTVPGSAALASNPPSHPIATAFTVPVADQVVDVSCSPVVCRGTAVGGATYTGDWSGTSTYSYGFAYLPSGAFVVAITEQVAGTVAACGTGSFTVLSRETILPSGAAHGEWTIIAGTGELLGLRGRGTSTAQYQANGTGTGATVGRVVC
jgi:hypothetical protein